MSLEDKVNGFVASLDSYEDQYEYYEQLMSINVPDNSTIKMHKNKINGCVSDTYLSGLCINNKMCYTVTSESRIVAGLGSMFCNIFSGESPHDIVLFNLNTLNTKYKEWLTPSRQNGISQILFRIKAIAQQCLI
jgi:cysteine desulfuration protein SufE